MTKLLKALKEEDGATMVEYALMLALIAIVCIIAVTTLGGKANNTFNASANRMPDPP